MPLAEGFRHLKHGSEEPLRSLSRSLYIGQKEGFFFFSTAMFHFHATDTVASNKDPWMEGRNMFRFRDWREGIKEHIRKASRCF